MAKKAPTGQKGKYIKIIFEPKECVICKEPFKPVNAQQKYCSTTCSEKAKKISYDQLFDKGRIIIFNRDGFRCIYCGRTSIEDGIKLQMDHIIPINKGGTNTAGNLITSCEQCNSEKNDRLMETDRVLFVAKTRNDIFGISNTAVIRNKNNEYREILYSKKENF